MRALASAVLLAASLGACAPACDRGSGPEPSTNGGQNGTYWQPPEDGPNRAAKQAPPLPTLAGGHPRLFLRAEDLPRLRSWAVASSPTWRAMSQLLKTAKEDMDSGKIPGSGDCSYQSRFCESYAELFAFASLVGPEAERANYAERARTVLMWLIRKAAAAAPSDPQWGTRFSTYNRSRWVGEGFGLTVDWIYAALSKDDKQLIRTVFLRWAEDLVHATVTTANHPEPVGTLQSDVLVKDKQALRYAGNNYFVGHMRNLGLMAMSLDAADDPEERGEKRTYPRLRDYLGNAIGAWMYMQDRLFRSDAKGGAAPEGFEYGPETLAYITQLHLAIRTAGEEDSAKYGPHVAFDGLPFWNEAPGAYAHALSPAPVTRQQWLGPVHEPAWIGDGENYTPLDPIGFFGPLGVYGMLAKQPERVNAARYVETHLAAGGAQGFGRRAAAYNGGLHYLMAIFYFLLFDPEAPAPTDYRPKLPLEHLGEGMGQIDARTSWKPDATWFTYLCGWETIDHRHGDGNSFGLYRNGEWLTKERLGYGFHFENSDQHNTLAVENDRPRHADDQRIGSYWKRGSQYVFFSDDGKLLAHSFGKDFVYALGDSTGLYNSPGEHVHDVTHVSRSIVWLEPDAIVVFDRAATKTPGRFKRFFLQTPTEAKVLGDQATVTTKGGQQLFVRSLLPVKGRVAAASYPPGSGADKPAEDEPMTAVIRVEPRSMEKEVEFLHVLQGAAAGAAPERTELVQSTGGSAFAGAVVKDVAVLFPVKLETASEVNATVPAGVTRILVTGLEPGGGYAASFGGGKLAVKKGGGARADAGGVLSVGP